MSAPLAPRTIPSDRPLDQADAGLRDAIESACARIAPAWPLDRLIAVNPWWGFVGRPMEEAAAELGALGGAHLLMPRAWYLERYEAGAFTDQHLREALARAGSRRSATEVVAALREPRVEVLRGAVVADLVDARRDLGHAMSWDTFITRQVSQVCAAWFDEGQARWTPVRSGGLYPLWRELTSHDRSPRLLMGLADVDSVISCLPDDPLALIAQAVEDLAVPPADRQRYFTALLLRLPGWAAACAFRRWEARLAGGDDAQLVHLLAVRLAWELVLSRLDRTSDLAARWSRARRGWHGLPAAARRAEADDWICQRALELAYQERLTAGLAGPAVAAPAPAGVQAVFCIDVRSEVYRRALEASQPDVHTLGFAGFFGLPIAYEPPLGPARPQLPGLLAPAWTVRETGPAADRLAAMARERSERSAPWDALVRTAASAFAVVETTGLMAGAALLREGLGLGDPDPDPLRAAAGARGPGATHPALDRGADGSAADAAAGAALAAGILRGMSLTQGFARVIALIGHGASCANNPQAAGLHCGACGGQTGEVNARALAALLNAPAIRAALVAHGIGLPASTHVIAGLHDTTTDEVTLYDLDQVPDSHRDEVRALQRSLAAAGARARAERAPALGLPADDDRALLTALRRRAADWAEVRPEWALARNAAFVAAPRARTRGLNLEGRAFLHEYRTDADPDGVVLEQILTAPMVVAHWINLQYYASTVDPDRYGSGDKTLHNVVGGRVGVFEGAGGDLRIGLARQSVHDGTDWVHEPLRLSVFVEAPAAAIDRILAHHRLVRDLVQHEWVFLFRIDPTDGTVHQRDGNGWRPRSAALAPAIARPQVSAIP